ncbi:hypothetical protein GCM10025864_26390 [Luteimicrobium album]|uniref:Glycosyltransferase 2-like domain-containing protein n=1 Tax=Luteimicrobium album TaxID=1054550 RepID=A0ABQ6I275_9MICO|nr:hypothetical protein GCM10025864_26390 [Luteimicrobium album]
MRYLTPLVARTSSPLLRRTLRRAPRTFSAMIRVRNEEQFLEAAVRSIADSMDEIVIVDNLSTDGTPDVIARLRESLGTKVVPLRYPFEVARYGEENRRLASTKDGLRSPHLLANYYEWCLAHCTRGFVVKWDGDMIATDAFPALIDGLRSAEIAVRYFHGANLHASGTSLIAGLPYEDAEPRAFLRRFARYDNGFDVWERFRSPTTTGRRSACVTKHPTWRTCT